MKGPSRVVASANAHEEGSCAALRTREAFQARHSPTKGCHGVGSTPPQQVQIRLVRIRTKMKAAKAAVKTLLQRSANRQLESNSFPPFVLTPSLRPRRTIFGCHPMHEKYKTPNFGQGWAPE